MTAMNKLPVPSWADLREAARILGELSVLPPCTSEQAGCFLELASKLLDAKVAVLMRARANRKQPLVLEALEARGFDGDHERNVFRDDVRYHRYRANPFLTRIAEHLCKSIEGCQVYSRSDLVADQDWYAAEYVQDTYKRLELDDLLVSVAPGEDDDGFVLIAYLRAWGNRRLFGQREQALAGLFGEATRMCLYRVPEISWDRRRQVLPARLREVRRLLLRGFSEKQIADHLKLSPSTVHRHVNRLYGALGISSRSDLFLREMGRLSEQLGGGAG